MDQHLLRGQYPAVVTVAYYALVKLDQRILSHTEEKSPVERSGKHHVPGHGSQADPAKGAGDALPDMTHSPIAFELLPRKFTIRELADLYKAILGVEIDHRNFRKKIIGCGYIQPTGEKEKGVPHKPAAYFVFDKNRYKKEEKKTRKLNFINWNE